MRTILLTLILIHWTGSTPVGAPSKEWWDELRSTKGLCCSFADGSMVQSPDWERTDDNYLVRIEGEWYIVPPSAIVKVRNLAGFAVVWPYKDPQGKLQIRCFIPGPES